MNAQNLKTLLRKSDRKLNIFTNLEILNQYNCNEQEIFDLIREFLNDEEKVNLFCCPHFQGYKSKIIECISDQDIKIKILAILLLETVCEKKHTNKNEKLRILQTLDVQTLVDFFRSNKENDIQPYEIVSLLDSKKQMQFISTLETMNLTLSKKKEILLTLNDDVKQTIDSGDFS